MPWLLFLLSCEGPGFGQVFDGMEVVSARLDHFSVASLSFLGGRLAGDAELHAIGQEGQEHSMPVTIQGATAGAIYSLSLPISEDGIELELPGESIPADLLLGDYTGSYEALVMGIGVSSLHMQNGDGVYFELRHTAVGMAISVAWSRLSILPMSEGDTAGLDTGFPD
jgi:hypothetical protein